MAEIPQDVWIAALMAAPASAENFDAIAKDIATAIFAERERCRALAYHYLTVNAEANVDQVDRLCEAIRDGSLLSAEIDAELQELLDLSTGPDGEIYGHKE